MKEKLICSWSRNKSKLTVKKFSEFLREKELILGKKTSLTISHLAVCGGDTYWLRENTYVTKNLRNVFLLKQETRQYTVHEANRIQQDRRQEQRSIHGSPIFKKRKRQIKYRNKTLHKCIFYT